MSDQLPLALIIEDEPAIAQLLATILRMQGYRTKKVAHGDQVLDQLAASRPDLVTLDLNLPGMGGAAILRHLRADPANVELPVIVISACTQIEPGLAADVQAVLTKPFELNELISAVQAVACPTSPAALQIGA